jgi:hypothetical protein
LKMTVLRIFIDVFRSEDNNSIYYQMVTCYAGQVADPGVMD